MCQAMGSAVRGVRHRAFAAAASSSACSMPDIAKLGAAGHSAAVGEFSPPSPGRVARAAREAEAVRADLRTGRCAFARFLERYPPALHFSSGSDWPLWRITAAPDKAPKLVSALRGQMDCRAAYDWSGGLIWIEVSPASDASATILRRIIAEFVADAMLVRAPQATRAAVDVFQPLAEANMALIRAAEGGVRPAPHSQSRPDVRRYLA